MDDKTWFVTNGLCAITTNNIEAKLFGNHFFKAAWWIKKLQHFLWWSYIRKPLILFIIIMAAMWTTTIFFQVRLSEPRHYCQPTSYSHPWFTRNELHFFGRWRHTLHSGSSYLVKMRIDMLILSATLLLLCKLPTFVVEILTCLCKSYFKMSGNIAVMITMNKTNGFLMYDRHRNCCNLFIHLTCLKKRLT